LSGSCSDRLRIGDGAEWHTRVKVTFL
jgi:hypothetical protein